MQTVSRVRAHFGALGFFFAGAFASGAWLASQSCKMRAQKSDIERPSVFAALSSAVRVAGSILTFTLTGIFSPLEQSRHRRE
jgi:hypothetical protein